MKFSKNQWIVICGTILVPAMIAALSLLESKSENNSAMNTGINNGVIAGKIVVAKPKKRIVDNQLINYIKINYPNKAKPITIIYNSSSQDAEYFANLLKNYLVSNGWIVSGFTPGLQGCSPINGICFFSTGIYITSI